LAVAPGGTLELAFSFVPHASPALVVFRPFTASFFGAFLFPAIFLKKKMKGNTGGQFAPWSSPPGATVGE
jgi:hypothetical protein